MKRIGVTGGIGSGKSTFSGLLERRGAVYFDADREANRIMETDSKVKEELRKVLGPNAYKDDGSVNKRHVSEAIFSDDGLRKQVGQIVHPRVLRAFEQQAESAEKEGQIAIVREAAILPNAQSRLGLDVLVVVMADPEIRIQRVMNRNSLTRELVLDRMMAQPSDEEYLEAADSVIWNNGTTADLERKVEAFWTALLAKSV